MSTAAQIATPSAGASAEATRRAALWARERRRAPLWTPVLFGLGVQVYVLAPSEPSLLALAVALGAAASLAAGALLWARGEAVAFAAIACACLLGGFGWAGARAHAVAAPVLDGEREALVEGRIAALSQSAAGRPRLTLRDVRVWGLEAARTPARLRVTLLSARDANGLAPGDRVSVMARLSPPGGPVEPGAFDFARAAWFERLGAVGVSRGRLARLAPAPAGGPLAEAREALAGARYRLGEALRARLPGEAGAFAAAIVTGDRAGLPVAALAALRDSGLAHLLAISGLHMAIVCGLVFGGTRLALAATGAAAGRMAERVAARDVAAVAALAAGLCYLLVSGASIATQRAFVMAAVALTAVLAGRAAVTLRGLALAAWVVLVLTPEAVLSVGFQMSFAATVALVAAYEAARERGVIGAGKGIAATGARYVAALVATSLIAGLATAPFAAFHFNRAAVYGLMANLGGVPLMGLIVAPALAVAAPLAGFGLEAPALAVAGAGIDGILSVARWTASLPGAVEAVPAAPPATLWVVTAGGLWLCLWRSRLRWLGLGPLLAALALWTHPGPRPALLIGEAGAVGAMTPAGRAVEQGRAGSFAADTWLRRDGRPEDDPLRFEADGAARIAPMEGGWRVVVWTRSRLGRKALGTLCAPASLVIAPFARAPAPRAPAPWRTIDANARAALAPEACHVLDRRALAASGPLVGRLSEAPPETRAQESASAALPPSATDSAGLPAPRRNALILEPVSGAHRLWSPRREGEAAHGAAAEAQ